MGLVRLTERHESEIAGVLSCYYRIITKGTLPELGDAGGMAAYLTQRRIRIFDFVEFVKPLTEAIKSYAKQTAADHGLEIQYISSKKDFRQEREVAKDLEKRGGHPGLVRIFSAIEPCTTYEPRFNKETNRAYLKPDDGKCLHYYFYFIDEELGLCYRRVPTWCPFRLQFYCNGHNWLARQLDRRKIGYIHTARQRVSPDRRLGCPRELPTLGTPAVLSDSEEDRDRFPQVNSRGCTSKSFKSGILLKQDTCPSVLTREFASRGC
jgi:hypothetical protein